MTSPWEAEIGSVRVLYGEGRYLEAAEVVTDLGCRRPLVVSDPGILAAGHLRRLESALIEAGHETLLYSEVSENPTSDQVEAGARFAAPHRPDCIVALGGGSAMDCAKGINFLLSSGGSMQDYWGFGLAQRDLLRSIGIPTTAGTGSEAQSYALITDAESHRKMACGDRRVKFRTVILDPTLLESVPGTVASTAGIDAVSHAVESFVSSTSTPISRMLSKKAWPEGTTPNSFQKSDQRNRVFRKLLAEWEEGEYSLPEWEY